MTPNTGLPSPSGAPGGAPSSIPWQELIETLYRRRWTWIIASVMGVLAATLQVWLKPPAYRAQAKVMLIAQPSSGDREEAMPDKQIKGELVLLKSPAFIKGVLENYGKDGNRPGMDSEAIAKSDPEVIAERIEAGPIDKSSVVQLSFRDRDPKWAAHFINNLLAKHVARVADLNEQINTRSFFEQQRDIMARRMLEAREALTAFRERQGVELLTGDVNQVRSVIHNLETERVGVETEVLELEAKIEFFSGEINSLPETVAAETRLAENESTTLLRSRISELQIERSELRARYTPTSTVIRTMDQQIEEAIRLLEENGKGDTVSLTTTAVNPSLQAMEIDLVSTRAELIEATARVKALSEQQAQYRGRLSEIERAAAELERLENEVESAKKAKDLYRQREEEARLSAALDDSNIASMIIVERAMVPKRPEPSHREIKILIGALAGLLIGTGWALVRDWLNPSVKSSIQAERLIGVPVIAEIPFR